MDRESLLSVTRFDTIDRSFFHVLHHSVGGVVKGENGFFSALEDVVVILRQVGVAQEIFRWAITFFIQKVYHVGIHRLKYRLAGVQRIEILDFAGRVVLSLQAQRLGLEPEVYILGDENYLSVTFLLLQEQRGIKDSMIRLVFVED